MYQQLLSQLFLTRLHLHLHGRDRRLVRKKLLLKRMFLLLPQSGLRHK
jgi:hypothetical protein